MLVTRVSAVLAVCSLVGCGRLEFAALDAGADARADRGPARPRTPIVIDKQLPGTPLLDITMAFVLGPTRYSIELAAGNLGNLSFADANGQALAFELEQTVDRLIAWVRIPRIDNSPQTIYITYDAARSPLSAWSDDYEAVWHMEGAGNAIDATGNGHDGANINVGGPVGAIVGDGRTFTTIAGSRFTVADAPSLAFDQITLSGWRIDTTHGAYTAVIGRQRGTSIDSDLWLGSKDANPGVEVSPGGVTVSTYSTRNMPLDTWYHTAGTYDGMTESLYIDGAFDSATVTPGGPLSHTAAELYLGADCDNIGPCPNVDFNDATFDELRIERVARSAAWIAFEVAAMRDLVLSYGTLEP